MPYEPSSVVRRTIGVGLALGLLLTGCHPQHDAPAPPKRRIANPPNFVILVGGDIGWGDLGCFGQKHIATPNIDGLAREGIRLSQFYAGDPTGVASCWCLLTGRDMNAARGEGPSRFLMRPEMPTVGEVLQAAGYRTGYVGPWTLGGADPANSPGQNGFAQWTTLPTAAGLPDYPAELERNGEPVSVAANAGGKPGQNLTDVLLAEAVALLQAHREGDPFLLLVVCPPPAAAANPSLAAYAGRDWPESRKAYAAKIAEFDRAAGLMMDALAKLDLAKRTALIVTAASGPAADDEGDLEFFASTGGLRGRKGTLYEGAIRVPFVIRWPGQQFQGVERDDAAVMWDLLPTLAELSGAMNVPRRRDGVSIAPMLRGGVGDKRDMLYWELAASGGVGQAVQMGEWKVVRLPGKTQREDCELYNLKKDPQEKSNVAAKYPEVVDRFIK